MANNIQNDCRGGHTLYANEKILFLANPRWPTPEILNFHVISINVDNMTVLKCNTSIVMFFGSRNPFFGLFL